MHRQLLSLVDRSTLVSPCCASFKTPRTAAPSVGAGTGGVIRSGESRHKASRSLELRLHLKCLRFRIKTSLRCLSNKGTSPHTPHALLKKNMCRSSCFHDKHKRFRNGRRNTAEFDSQLIWERQLRHLLRGALRARALAPDAH